MFHLNPLPSGALALLIATVSVLQARAGEQVFNFADPGSPGKVVIQMGLGDVRVVGADVTEVKVVSDEELAGDPEPRADGLRRLDSGGNDHAVSRDGNVIRIVSNGMFGNHGHGAGGPSDLVVTVPVATGVVIERNGPGETVLEKLSGDVEVRAAIGDITLDGLSGGAVVETVNGDVRAVFTGLAADHPVHVSAVRGDVDLRVPVSAKADVRFRTLRGEILTDFGDELQTSMESGGVGDEQATAEADRAIAEQEKTQAREMARQAEKAARQAENEARRVEAEARRGGEMNVHVSIPPIPPMPPMPPLAGGRVVAGALNGGGTDISVTTLNGDVRFRKGD